MMIGAGRMTATAHADIGASEARREAWVRGCVLNGADVGMIQRRSRTRFAAEALQRSRITRHIVRQELERDEASQARVLGLVDDTHAATAELFDNAIVRDRGVDHLEGAGRMMPDDRALASGSQFVLNWSFARRVKHN